MKIKMMFDSSVGFSREETEKKGAMFVPIVISIDGKDYYDGIDIEQEKLIKLMLEGGHTFKTAAATLGDLSETFKEGLKEADAIIYLPISKELSSTYNNAVMVSQQDEFKGKVFVINSLYATPWTHLHIDDLVKKANESKTPEEVIEFAEELIKDTIIFMSPATLLHLKNGGRISKAEYIAGSLLKIKPIIVGYKGAITSDKHGIRTPKARGVDKAWAKMFEMLEDFKPKLDPKAEYEYIYFTYGEREKQFEGLVKDKFPAKRTVLGGAVMAHTGPEIYGVGVKKVVK